MLRQWIARLLSRRAPVPRTLGPIPEDSRAAWAWQLARALDASEGLAAVVEHRRPVAEDIEATYVPDSNVGREMSDALTVACGQYTHPYVALCLNRAVALADAAALHEARWGQRWSTKSGERGQFIEASCLARAWVRDGDLDRDVLADAAGEMIDAAARRWHGHEHQQQSLLLRGVQCLLLAGEFEEARSIVTRTRRRFGVTERYFEWTRDVAVICTESDESNSQPQRLALFDRLFEPLRHPCFRPLGRQRDSYVEESRGYLPPRLFDACIAWSYFPDDMMRLRLALIRWHCVLGQPIRGQWREIVAQINRTELGRDAEADAESRSDR